MVEKRKQPPKTRLYRGKVYQLYGVGGNPYMDKHNATVFVDTMRNYKYMNAFKIKTDRGWLVYYRKKK